MKKTLVALAALAAASAFAQSTVTISGTYNAAMQKSATGQKTTDLTDSTITFAASEDLGGGMKAFVSSQIQAGGRQDITSPAFTQAATAAVTVGNQAKKDGVYGRNATVGLTGGFGGITIGRVEGTNTTEKAIVAPVWLPNGFDQSYLLGAKGNYTTTAYTLPTMVPGLTVGAAKLTLLNDKFAPASTAANQQLTVNAIDVAYTNGPVALYVTNKQVNDRVTSAPEKGTQTEVAGTYMMGPVKLGAAVTSYSGAYYSDANNSTAGNNTLLSAAYAVSSKTEVGFATVKRGDGNGITGAKGNAVAVQYALSKRTALNSTFGKVSQSGTSTTSQYRVGIKHSF